MNMLNRKYKPVLDSYKRYHYSEGPLYDTIAFSYKSVAPESSMVKATSQKKKDSFELIVGKDPQKGEWIRFVNNDESFEVHPKFGGTLQNWQFGSEIIIPESVGARLKEGNMFAQGGYRSYASIGGFRPIWALGTHHNPCILWSFPFSWKIITDLPEVKTIELSRSFYHVDATYRISIKKGTTGFAYSLKAVNKLDFTYGAFNFNLILSFCDSEINSTSLQWAEDQHLHRLPFSEVKTLFFVIPSRRSLQVKKQNYLLTIDCGEVGGAGFYVASSSTYITPDLHGVYKPLKKGDVTATQ